MENRLGWPGESNRALPLPSLLPLNYASLVAAQTRIRRRLCREVDEILQYCMGGNFTIFDKDHDMRRKADRSKVLAAKHMALLLVCMVGGSRARLDARTEFEISQRSPKGG
jgi:hypothetical protein